MRQFSSEMIAKAIIIIIICTLCAATNVTTHVPLSRYNYNRMMNPSPQVDYYGNSLLGPIFANSQYGGYPAEYSKYLEWDRRFPAIKHNFSYIPDFVDRARLPPKPTLVTAVPPFKKEQVDGECTVPMPRGGWWKDGRPHGVHVWVANMLYGEHIAWPLDMWIDSVRIVPNDISRECLYPAEDIWTNQTISIRYNAEVSTSLTTLRTLTQPSKMPYHCKSLTYLTNADDSRTYRFSIPIFANTELETFYDVELSSQTRHTHSWSSFGAGQWTVFCNSWYNDRVTGLRIVSPAKGLDDMEVGEYNWIDRITNRSSHPKNWNTTVDTPSGTTQYNLPSAQTPSTITTSAICGENGEHCPTNYMPNGMWGRHVAIPPEFNYMNECCMRDSEQSPYADDYLGFGVNSRNLKLKNSDCCWFGLPRVVAFTGRTAATFDMMIGAIRTNYSHGMLHLIGAQQAHWVTAEVTNSYTQLNPLPGHRFPSLISGEILDQNIYSANFARLEVLWAEKNISWVTSVAVGSRKPYISYDLKIGHLPITGDYNERPQSNFALAEEYHSQRTYLRDGGRPGNDFRKAHLEDMSDGMDSHVRGVHSSVGGASNAETINAALANDAGHFGAAGDDDTTIVRQTINPASFGGFFPVGVPQTIMVRLVMLRDDVPDRQLGWVSRWSVGRVTVPRFEQRAFRFNGHFRSESTDSASPGSSSRVTTDTASGRSLEPTEVVLMPPDLLSVTGLSVENPITDGFINQPLDVSFAEFAPYLHDLPPGVGLDDIVVRFQADNTVLQEEYSTLFPVEAIARTSGFWPLEDFFGTNTKSTNYVIDENTMTGSRRHPRMSPLHLYNNRSENAESMTPLAFPVESVGSQQLPSDIDDFSPAGVLHRRQRILMPPHSGFEPALSAGFRVRLMKLHKIHRVNMTVRVPSPRLGTLAFDGISEEPYSDHVYTIYMVPGSCRGCERGQAIATPCAGRAKDTVCKECGVCAPNQYVLRDCHEDRGDTLCANCTSSCGEGLRLVGACDGTGKRDILCTPCTACPLGHYRTGGCSGGAEDSQCAVCPNLRNHPSFQHLFDADNGASEAPNVLDGRLYVPLGCPSSFSATDLVGALELAPAEFLEFLSGINITPGNGGGDAGSEPRVTYERCQECAAGQREDPAAPCGGGGGSNDRSCIRCSQCFNAATMAQHSTPLEELFVFDYTNGNLDAIQEDTPLFFKHNLVDSYASRSCSMHADTDCRACGSCPVGQFAASACTNTTNTVCRSCSTCPDGSRVLHACTATADTVCAPCSDGCSAEGTAACTANPSQQLECHCKPGFSGTECAECTAGRFGLQCHLQCACDAVGAQSQSCEAENGQCSCREGFEGHFCERCEQGRYGANCEEQCECENGFCSQGRGGTGVCACFAGWRGSRCEQEAADISGVEALYIGNYLPLFEAVELEAGGNYGSSRMLSTGLGSFASYLCDGSDASEQKRLSVAIMGRINQLLESLNSPVDVPQDELKKDLLWVQRLLRVHDLEHCSQSIAREENSSSSRRLGLHRQQLQELLKLTAILEYEALGHVAPLAEFLSSVQYDRTYSSSFSKSSSRSRHLTTHSSLEGGSYQEDTDFRDSSGRTLRLTVPHLSPLSPRQRRRLDASASVPTLAIPPNVIIYDLAGSLTGLSREHHSLTVGSAPEWLQVIHTDSGSGYAVQGSPTRQWLLENPSLASLPVDLVVRSLRNASIEQTIRFFVKPAYRNGSPYFLPQFIHQHANSSFPGSNLGTMDQPVHILYKELMVGDQLKIELKEEEMYDDLDLPFGDFVSLNCADILASIEYSYIAGAPDLAFVHCEMLINTLEGSPHKGKKRWFLTGTPPLQACGKHVRLRLRLQDQNGAQAVGAVDIVVREGASALRLVPDKHPGNLRHVALTPLSLQIDRQLFQSEQGASAVINEIQATKDSSHNCAWLHTGQAWESGIRVPRLDGMPPAEAEGTVCTVTLTGRNTAGFELSTSFTLTVDPPRRVPAQVTFFPSLSYPQYELFTKTYIMEDYINDFSTVGSSGISTTFTMGAAAGQTLPSWLSMACAPFVDVPRANTPGSWAHRTACTFSGNATSSGIFNVEIFTTSKYGLTLVSPLTIAISAPTMYRSLLTGPGPCSVECGTGYSYQNVLCLNYHGREVDTRNCGFTDATRYKLLQCNTHPCMDQSAKYKWRTGPWGSCSAGCSVISAALGNEATVYTPVVTRTVECTEKNDMNMITVAAESKCNSWLGEASRPASEMSCRSHVCTTASERSSALSTFADARKYRIVENVMVNTCANGQFRDRAGVCCASPSASGRCCVAGAPDECGGCSGSNEASSISSSGFGDTCKTHIDLEFSQSLLSRALCSNSSLVAPNTQLGASQSEAVRSSAVLTGAVATALRVSQENVKLQLLSCASPGSSGSAVRARLGVDALHSDSAFTQRQLDEKLLSALNSLAGTFYGSGSSTGTLSHREVTKEAVCGNGVCEKGETDGSCAADCGPSGEAVSSGTSNACIDSWYFDTSKPSGSQLTVCSNHGFCGLGTTTVDSSGAAVLDPSSGPDGNGYCSCSVGYGGASCNSCTAGFSALGSQNLLDIQGGILLECAPLSTGGLGSLLGLGNAKAVQVLDTMGLGGFLAALVIGTLIIAFGVGAAANHSYHRWDRSRKRALLLESSHASAGSEGMVFHSNGNRIRLPSVYDTLLPVHLLASIRKLYQTGEASQAEVTSLADLSFLHTAALNESVNSLVFNNPILTMSAAARSFQSNANLVNGSAEGPEESEGSSKGNLKQQLSLGSLITQMNEYHSRRSLGSATSPSNVDLNYGAAGAGNDHIYDDLESFGQNFLDGVFKDRISEMPESLCTDDQETGVNFGNILGTPTIEEGDENILTDIYTSSGNTARNIYPNDIATAARTRNGSTTSMKIRVHNSPVGPSGASVEDVLNPDSRSADDSNSPRMVLDNSTGSSRRRRGNPVTSPNCSNSSSLAQNNNSFRLDSNGNSNNISGAGGPKRAKSSIISSTDPNNTTTNHSIISNLTSSFGNYISNSISAAFGSSKSENSSSNNSYINPMSHSHNGNSNTESQNRRNQFISKQKIISHEMPSSDTLSSLSPIIQTMKQFNSPVGGASAKFSSQVKENINRNVESTDCHRIPTQNPNTTIVRTADLGSLSVLSSTDNFSTQRSGIYNNSRVNQHLDVDALHSVLPSSSSSTSSSTQHNIVNSNDVIIVDPTGSSHEIDQETSSWNKSPYPPVHTPGSNTHDSYNNRNDSRNTITASDIYEEPLRASVFVENSPASRGSDSPPSMTI